MAAFLIIFCKDIEEEWFNIIIQGFVVQKEFGQQAKILTVNFAHISINLESKTDAVISSATNMLGQKMNY